MRVVGYVDCGRRSLMNTYCLEDHTQALDLCVFFVFAYFEMAFHRVEHGGGVAGWN